MMLRKQILCVLITGADTGEENGKEGKEGKDQDNKEKSKDKSDEGTICDFLFIVYFQKKQ